jgi:hypothetical protein
MFTVTAGFQGDEQQRTGSYATTAAGTADNINQRYVLSFFWEGQWEKVPVVSIPLPPVVFCAADSNGGRRK